MALLACGSRIVLTKQCFLTVLVAIKYCRGHPGQADDEDSHQYQQNDGLVNPRPDTLQGKPKQLRSLRTQTGFYMVTVYIEKKKSFSLL